MLSCEEYIQLSNSTSNGILSQPCMSQKESPVPSTVPDIQKLLKKKSLLKMVVNSLHVCLCVKW